MKLQAELLHAPSKCTMHHSHFHNYSSGTPSTGPSDNFISPLGGKVKIYWTWESLAAIPMSLILFSSSEGVMTSELWPWPSTMRSSSKDIPERVITVEGNSFWLEKRTSMPQQSDNINIHHLFSHVENEETLKKHSFLFISYHTLSLWHAHANVALSDSAYLFKIFIIKGDLGSSWLSNSWTIVGSLLISYKETNVSYNRSENRYKSKCLKWNKGKCPVNYFNVYHKYREWSQQSLLRVMTGLSHAARL